MKKKIDYDEIISQIMENESAAKHLSDEEYQKITQFFKEKLFDFLVSLYKCKKSTLNKHKIKLNQLLIEFSTEILRKFNHQKVDIQLEILTNTLELFNINFFQSEIFIGKTKKII
jgi:hypothetical protein